MPLLFLSIHQPVNPALSSGCLLQARRALAQVCTIVRSSEDCQGASLADMVLALRASSVAAEATLVVAVAAPDLRQARFAVNQAVQLIASLSF